MSNLRLPPGCLSNLALDEVLGDSAEPAARERAAAHVAGCTRCALRFETLARQREGFLERVPTWEDLHAQATGKRGGGLRRLLWGGGAALAAASAALAVSFALAPAGSAPGATRTKGGSRIGAYVKHGERVTRADDGAAVEPGDHVRFVYSSDEPVHFALLNRDAQQVTTYFPLGAETVRVAAGHDVALDFSIELDGQAGREEVHGLFCQQPQPLEPLRAALQAQGRLPPLPNCRVDVLTLEKKVR